MVEDFASLPRQFEFGCRSPWFASYLVVPPSESAACQEEAVRASSDLAEDTATASNVLMRCHLQRFEVVSSSFT